MDFGGLIIVGIVWWLFNLITRSRPDSGRSTTTRTLPPAHPPATGDATQREGSMLERLLRELERNMEDGGRPTAPRPVPRHSVPLPSAEEVEELESLEEPERVVSLETEVVRTPRVRVDHDDDAEQVERRRIAAAEARSGALTRADHRRFDQRIRQEPADHTAVRRYTRAQLRNAIIWREILGPPVSERDV